MKADSMKGNAENLSRPDLPNYRLSIMLLVLVGGTVAYLLIKPSLGSDRQRPCTAIMQSLAIAGTLQLSAPFEFTVGKRGGMGAMPVFYADREHLIALPYVERLHTGNTKVERLFIHGRSSVKLFEIFQPRADLPSKKLQNRGFDTHLITGRPPAPHFHSWTHYAWQAHEMWPDMHVRIHQDKATELQIADGDEVSVETAHGTVRVRAWLYAGTRTDTVFLPIGWDSSQSYYPWNSVNYLTDQEQRDSLSDHSNLKIYLFRVIR